MSISSVTSTPTGSANNLDLLNAQTHAQGKATLNQEDFFKLLTTQLSAQDPLKPMDDTSFISQMASFSSLQQMQALAKEMGDFTSRQTVANANEYLGKTVSATDANGATQTGVVTSVNIDAGVPTLIVNGVACGVDTVSSVSTNQQPPADTQSTSVPATSN